MKILQVFRSEGQWPVRMGLETLAHYRKNIRPEIYKEQGGLFAEQGESWQKMRTLANPIMLQPRIIKLYCKQVDEVAKEFVGM